LKKFFIFVSCFAVLLVLSKVSIAQEVAVVPCNCPAAVAPFAMPFMHPHMHYNAQQNINARDIRRTARLEGRMNIRQMQVQQRLGTAPAFAGAPGAVGEMPAFTPGMYAPDAASAVPGGFWAGPTVQTGRMNNSKQRVTANNVPVVNFMSVVRGGQRSL